MKMLIQKVNTCPKCGSEDLDWGDSGLQDEFYFYKLTCNSCGTEATEWHKLVYDETLIDE